MRYVIREKFFRVTEDSVIQDEQGAPMYQVKGKIFSLHHTLVLMDLAGNELATVKKQIISMTPKFQITRHGEEAATVRKNGAVTHRRKLCGSWKAQGYALWVHTKGFRKLPTEQKDRTQVEDSLSLLYGQSEGLETRCSFRKLFMSA